MQAVLAGLDEGEAVMARINMAEIGAERLENVIAQAKSQDAPVERRPVIDALDREHGVPHAERAGAEARDAAAGAKWLRAHLGAMKRFEPVAEGIGKDDEVLDASLTGKRAAAARDRDAGSF